MPIPKGMTRRAWNFTGDRNLAVRVAPINTPLVIGHFTTRMREEVVTYRDMNQENCVRVGVRIQPDDVCHNLYWLVVLAGKFLLAAKNQLGPARRNAEKLLWQFKNHQDIPPATTAPFDLPEENTDTCVRLLRGALVALHYLSG